MAPPRVVLIDGTGLIFRAFFALPATLTTTAGLPTNAAFGFAQMFRKILQGRQPTYGAVVFDAGGRTFRNELDPDYKAQRPRMPDALRRQLPSIDALVEAHHFPIVRVPGVEADDVIATLWKEARDRGMEVTVVSGDKDFAQLVTDDAVRLFDSTAEVFYDRDRIRRKWGVLPEQFPDYLALVGDAPDNIKGVPGIGKARAVELLATHGSLEALLDAPDLDPGIATKLHRHAERARLSRRLATVRTDVELPVGLLDLVLTPPTPADLNAIYRTLEFFSLLTAEAPDAHTGRRPQYFVCDTPEMARAALQNECTGPDPVGVHVLVELEDPPFGEVVGIALCPRDAFGLYFPFRGPGTTLGVAGIDLLTDWLEDASRPKCVHDAKAAMVSLGTLEVQLRGVVGDPALASYLMDPTRHLPHRIEQVARATLQRALQPLRGLVGGGRDRKRFGELTVDRAGAYACHLADATLGCWRVLEEQLDEEGLLGVLEEIDLPLAEVLADMEQTGILVDPAVFDELGRGFEAERAEVEAEVHRLAGRAFNVGSPKQLGTVLFDELGLPVIQRTKTGYSTASEVLDKLRASHPIIDAIERWRTLDKLINTYTEVLVHSTKPATGRIHTSFQQTASASGRLITTDPDLQRTPVRSPEFRRVREGFVAPPGHLVVSADWSQIELRLLAHLSEDPVLLDAYRTGADLHARTAAALFDCPEAAVTPEQRNVGKTVNFATIYGQGATALSQQLHIPHKDAKTYIDRFFALYAGVAEWRDQTVTRAHMDGFVDTLGGRRRHIPELATGNWSDRSYGERIAMNTPIQGSAADLCKVAMIGVHRALRDQHLDARMVLQIHDELLFEVPEGELEATVACVRAVMTGAWALAVPLVVDVGWGRSWAEAH
ncbi:MAG: DNA polymerase I [Myxococcota bacterium]